MIAFAGRDKLINLNKVIYIVKAKSKPLYAVKLDTADKDDTMFLTVPEYEALLESLATIPKE